MSVTRKLLIILLLYCKSTMIKVLSDKNWEVFLFRYMSDELKKKGKRVQKLYKESIIKQKKHELLF